MGATFGRVKTWVALEVLTHTDLNAEFDNILTNLTPGGIDDYSTNTTEMQSTVDPYPAGVASLATSMQGELQRIRYLLTQINGEAYWYIDPDNSLLSTSSPSYTKMTLTQATGTAPLTVSSTTRVANLNVDDSDKVDGFHASQTPGANTVPVLDAGGRYVHGSDIIIREPATDYKEFSYRGTSGKAIFGAGQNSYLASNAYFDGTDWRYMVTGAAALVDNLRAGTAPRYSQAGSGTAGNIITWNGPYTVWHSGNDGPYFSAVRSINQTLTSGVYTKIQFNSENQDSNNNYDPATNYRFTPTVAGMYSFSLSLAATAGTGFSGTNYMGIVKNSSLDSIGAFILLTATDMAGSTSFTTYMNGSSDYVEAYAVLTGTGTLSITNAVETVFSGGRIK